MYRNNRDPFNRHDPFIPPINPNGFFTEEFGHKKAREAKILGVVSLVGLLTMTLLAIVCGFLAIKAANASVRALGFESYEAKRGRSFGTIGLVGGVALFILSLVLTLTVLM